MVKVPRSLEVIGHKYHALEEKKGFSNVPVVVPRFCHGAERKARP